MLSVNDRLLNYNDKNDAYVKEYLDAVKEIHKTYKFPIVFKDRFGFRINATGAPEPTAPISIPLSANVIRNGVPEFWRYSPTFPVGGKITKKRIKVNGKISVKANEVELAFFLLYKCPFVKDGTLIVVNKQKEAESKIAARSRMISTRYLLYDEESLVYNAEETLRTVALAFGVRNAGDKEISLAEIKLALESVIENAEMSGDNERNEKAFKRAIEMDSIIKQRAIIQEAVDKDMIEFRHEINQWVMKNDKGQVTEKLCVVSPQEINRKEERLADWLRTHPFYKEAIEGLLGKENAFGEGAVLSEEFIKEAKRPDLMAQCKKYDINPIGKSNEEIKKLLLEKIQE